MATLCKMLTLYATYFLV